MNCIKKKYDEETLKQLQKIELEMLRKLDYVCVKYDIPYFLTFGSLIGAIRHQGFIPWDDDIDVYMMREDYERLCAVPTEEWGEEIYLSKPTDDIAANCEIYPRIYKKGTRFEPRNFNCRYISRDNKHYKEREIWLDIFMYDRVDNIEIALKQVDRMQRIIGLYKLAKFDVRIHKDYSKTLKLRCLLKKGLHYLINLFPQPEKRIYERYVRILKELGSAGEYVISYESAVKEEVIASAFRYDEVFPVHRVPFENITVNVQKNYHDALYKMYGDYMELPPEEKRINHAPMVLDFGDGRGNLMSRHIDQDIVKKHD